MASESSVKARRRIAQLVSACGVAAAVYGCQGVSNTTVVQCTSEDECRSLGPEFVNSTCDKSTRTCVRSAETIGSCTTNQECINAAAGQAAICRKSDKKCVSLLTPECPTLFAKNGVATLADDNTIVIGATTPSPVNELAVVMERAIELAHFELMSSVTGGLPPVSGSTAVRPLAIVACHEFAYGREGALRAANHLAHDIQVPVSIGPVDPSNQGPSVAQVYNPSKILSIFAAGNASAVASLPNPIAPTPILWRFGIDDRNLGQAPADFVTYQLQPALNAKGITTIKVAYVHTGDFLGVSAAAQLLPRLKFNGVTLAENQANNNFLEVNVGNVDDSLNNPNPQAKIGAGIAQIFAFQPNVIIHTYPPTVITRVLFPIEAGWPNPAQRPYHIGANTWNGFGPLFSFESAGPILNRYGRIFAVTNWTDLTGKTAPFPNSKQDLQAWTQRFNDRNPDLATSYARFYANVWALYDATYQAAYAIVALRDKPVTGENLASTRSLFGPQNSVAVNTYDGPSTGIAAAYNELLAGRGIDLDGLSGNLDLDETGGVDYSAEITCPVLSGGTVTGYKGSGFRYKPKTASFVTTADGTDTPPTSPLLGCPGP